MHPKIRPSLQVLEGPARTLAGWLDPLTARVRAEEIRWLAARPDFMANDPVAAGRSLVLAARAAATERTRVSERADTLRYLAAAAPPAASSAVLARHVRATVPPGWRRRADLAAIRRHLDVEALLEREAALVEAEGARIEVVARALGGLAMRLACDVWVTTGAAVLLADLVRQEQRPATRRPATAALARALILSPPRDRRGPGPIVDAFAALDHVLASPADDPWVRRAALDVLPGLAAPDARRWIERALAEHDGNESFLVRARAVEGLLALPFTWVPEVAATLGADPSELVRACLVDGLTQRLVNGQATALAPLARLAATDPEPRVRARAADGLGGAGGLDALAACLADTPLVASFALDAVERAVEAGTPLPARLHEALLALALDGASKSASESARRASHVLHLTRLAGTPAQALARTLAALRPEERRVVPLPPRVTPEGLAEALVPFATGGYGFSLEPSPDGVVVTRGDVLHPTAWRLLHELCSPAPAKRQAYAHTLGRADTGAIRVPPTGLAEESPTGVPGQRVRSDRAGTWEPAIPMVDDYLHAVGRDVVRIVTAEGITAVVPPVGRLARMRAWLQLTVRYTRFDALRGAALAEADPARQGRYVAALRDLGFTTRLEGRAGPSQRYLGGVVNPIAYLVSMGSASLTHLAIVVGLLGAVLLGRGVVEKRRISRARQALPLVIGGWGTRGKSGTERLKAGLFEGLGIPVLSKTTGCEAMVLHAPPGGHAMELFLFRPYDKATIWEQIDVAALGARLKSRALLWECMGLNPNYVDILQAGWMRDDLSTLTNAYPDHEDIQGPTGMDVAQALGGFAPPDALLLTTEQNMFPVIEEEATRRGTTVAPVPRRDRELIPQDLLDRMPHAEHPANVALVAAVAEALGLPRVEAIGWMAEHVVPDLGALIVCPPAPHLGRTVQFVNGMSANDALSFRHNWRHTGFASTDVALNPGKWLVTVVNNRADRVARSRVFAEILANQANAHRHVLIGTNLHGLVRYFEQAVEERLDRHALDGDPRRVDELFAHLRIVDPVALAEACGERLGVPAELRAAWAGAVQSQAGAPRTWAEAREAAEGLRKTAARLGEAEGAADLPDALMEALARSLARRGARTAPPKDARALYQGVARASLVLVEDDHASGDRIIATAVRAAPPGSDTWIMGVQNIKGTGLDFAYQWVWWRELHGALKALGSPDPARRTLALDRVETIPFASVLACEATLVALAPLADDARLGRRVALLVREVQLRRDGLLAARKTGTRTRRSPFVTLLERLMDPFDAMARRARAARVFDDLATQRISHRRAQSELRMLTERQKGGWLGR
jgi:poly-gamma-glutamate synthase PgsB/CapB